MRRTPVPDREERLGAVRAVFMTPEQQRRQDLQCEWLRAAIAAQNRRFEGVNTLEPEPSSPDED